MCWARRRERNLSLALPPPSTPHPNLRPSTCFRVEVERLRRVSGPFDHMRWGFGSVFRGLLSPLPEGRAQVGRWGTQGALRGEQKCACADLPPSLRGNRRAWLHARSCRHEYLWASVFFISKRRSGGFWASRGHILLLFFPPYGVQLLWSRAHILGLNVMGWALLFGLDGCGAFRCTLTWD